MHEWGSHTQASGRSHFKFILTTQSNFPPPVVRTSTFFWHVAASVVCVVGCFLVYAHLELSSSPLLQTPAATKNKWFESTDEDITNLLYFYLLNLRSDTHTDRRQTGTDRPTHTPHHTHTTPHTTPHHTPPQNSISVNLRTGSPFFNGCFIRAKAN